MSNEMHPQNSGSAQMEADGKGVSQQERRCATEVINQPLGSTSQAAKAGHVSINRPTDKLTGLKKKGGAQGLWSVRLRDDRLRRKT